MYECECLNCGYTLRTTQHCIDIICPRCGGNMRRADRPGVGKENRTGVENDRQTVESI